MKKKFNLAKITSFVLLLTVTAMILVAGTYAKYSSQASGTDATVVAKWSFKVNGTEIAIKNSKPTVTFDLFKTINDTATGEKETDVADGLIAPGTTGAFEFKLFNSSEVTTRYAINLEIKEGSNVPLEFSLDGGNSWTKITELSDLVATDIIGIGLSKNVTVQWKWAFGENETTDASLGGQKVQVTASITATQVDSGDGNSNGVIPAKQLVSDFDKIATITAENTEIYEDGSVNNTLATTGVYMQPFIYSDVTLFEENQLESLQVFVGNIESNTEYTFTLNKIQSSSVAVNSNINILEQYVINVNGNDLVSTSWNTIDISDLNIYVNKGETIGFGYGTDTLPTYYYTGIKNNNNFYGKNSQTDSKLRLRTNFNLLYGLEGRSSASEDELKAVLKNKNISLLAASIVTYEGYSNNANYNSTIENNEVFYTSEKLSSVNDTFWMQTINEYDMNLVVNNSYSGGAVLDDRANAAGYLTRPMQLHDDNGENAGTNPEILVIYMGYNDFLRDTGSVGSLPDDLYTTVESKVDNNDDSVPVSFEAGYIEMIYKIRKTYGDIDIFVWGLPNSNVELDKLEKYNTAIKQIAEHYDGYYLDFASHPVMSGANYKNYTVGDNIHPNATGMDIMSEILIDGFRDFYLNS